MPGGLGIINIKKDFSSWPFNSNKVFIPYLIQINKANNGGCSSVAERTVVVRKTRVRFSPSTLEINKNKKEDWSVK